MTLPIDTVLVRHGESEGNAAKRRSEKGDTTAFTERFRNRHTASYRLTERGRKQAARAGEWLRQEFFKGNIGFDRYITSEYVRAMETAGLLNLPAASWYVDYNIRERDWGDMEASPTDERETKYGDMLKKRDVEPFYWLPPGGGESLARACNRLRATLDTLHREGSDKRVVIVCHGEVMWAFRVMLERMSQDRFKQLHQDETHEHKIYNCQILHYTRRNPETGKLEKNANWMRSIRPTKDPAVVSPWQVIQRPRFSNSELLERVNKFEAMVV